MMNKYLLIEVGDYAGVVAHTWKFLRVLVLWTISIPNIVNNQWFNMTFKKCLRVKM